MNTTNERFIAVFDAKVTDLDSVRLALTARNITMVDHFDFLHTVVLTGPTDAIKALPTTVPGIKSVEREGTVRVPE